MRRWRLWLFLSLLAFKGCLVLPSDVPSVEADITNRPPKLVDNLASPSPEETMVILNSLCSKYYFTVYAKDPDIDRLYYRVFINYSLYPAIYIEGSIDPAAIDNNNLAELSFHILAKDNNHFAAAQNQGYTFDVVELLLTDRPFADEGRMLSEDAQQDRYTWTIVRRDMGPCLE